MFLTGSDLLRSRIRNLLIRLDPVKHLRKAVWKVCFVLKRSKSEILLEAVGGSLAPEGRQIDLTHTQSGSQSRAAKQVGKSRGDA